MVWAKCSLVGALDPLGAYTNCIGFRSKNVLAESFGRKFLLLLFR